MASLPLTRGIEPLLPMVLLLVILVLVLLLSSSQRAPLLCPSPLMVCAVLPSEMEEPRSFAPLAVNSSESDLTRGREGARMTTQCSVRTRLTTSQLHCSLWQVHETWRSIVMLSHLPARLLSRCDGVNQGGASQPIRDEILAGRQEKRCKIGGTIVHHEWLTWTPL